MKLYQQRKFKQKDRVWAHVPEAGIVFLPVEIVFVSNDEKNERPYRIKSPNGQYTDMGDEHLIDRSLFSNNLFIVIKPFGPFFLKDLIYTGHYHNCFVKLATPTSKTQYTNHYQDRHKEHKLMNEGFILPVPLEKVAFMWPHITDRIKHDIRHEFTRQSNLYCICRECADLLDFLIIKGAKPNPHYTSCTNCKKNADTFWRTSIEPKKLTKHENRTS